MTIKTMECQPAFHYELQTFSEKRETAWTYAAIRPGYTDMMGGGSIGCVPPLPWEIMEEPTQVFKDEVRLVQVTIFYTLILNEWFQWIQTRLKSGFDTIATIS